LDPLVCEVSKGGLNSYILFMRLFAYSLFFINIFFLSNFNVLHAEWISEITSKMVYSKKKCVIDPFISSDMDIEVIHNFFDKNFYKVDACFFEYNESNPLNLSTEFMEAYLRYSYKLRRDSFIKPISNLEVDAIICSLGTSAMTVRLMALKKMIELGWEFRKVHVITRSQSDKIAYEKLIEDVFPDKSILPEFNYVFTHQATQRCERGCKILKRRNQISSYYMVIESSDFFASKVEGRCRKIFGLASTCLGSNSFPLKDWREEAKIHGYDELFSDEQMVCQWFYSHMQFLARKIHFEFIHGLDLDEEELFAASQLRSVQKMTAPTKQYTIFEKLSLIYYERAVCESQKEFHYVTNLLRSFGLIHYIQNLPFDNDVDTLLTRIPLSMNQMSPVPGCWHKLLIQSDINRQRLDLIRNTTSKKMLEPDCDITELILEINRERDDILQDIVHHSENILGRPPCKFSIIVYGSSGRNEATPYSDLEFGVLYETNTNVVKEYFQALSACVMFQIVNLSETILFQFNFPCFNLKDPPLAKHQWFLDDVIPRGFSIDILDDPHSSKLPIATGKGVSFIGTPKAMADKSLFLMKEENFGYSNLSERLAYGSKRLFQEYRDNKRQVFDAVDRECLIQTFEEIMRNYSRTVTRSWDNKIDIKNTFYRPISLALESLSDLFHIDHVSSLDRINELYMRQIITKHEAGILTEYMYAIQKTRLSLTLKRGGQYEGVEKSDLPEIEALFLDKAESEKIFNRLELQLYE